MLSTTAHSLAFSSGTKRSVMPVSFAWIAIGRAPVTFLTFPPSESSPKNADFEMSALSWSEAMSNAMRIGTSYIGPSFFLSAGERLTVMRPTGNCIKLFFIAARTLSRDSETAASGRPTRSNFGNARLSVEASTPTEYVPRPKRPMLFTFANIKNSPLPVVAF